jgi:flavin-dependent dehydrogenase
VTAERGILIAGAGPAGSVAAVVLASAGADVLLVDRAEFPRPKVCGGCLGARAVEALGYAGVADLPDQLGAPALDRVFLTAGRGCAELALPPGRALSRTALDEALVGEAVRAGAEFLPGTRATLVAPGLVRLTDEEVRARVVLAADGLSGDLLRDVPGFEARVAPASRIGAACAPLAPIPFYRSGAVYMIAGRGGYAGIVRVEDGSLHVAAALDPAAVRAVRGPGPAVAAILEEAGAPPVPGLCDARWAGTAALTRRRIHAAGERLFLIGDAAGYVEPFTGEGMAWAMASGLAVTPLALEACDRWRPSLASRWESEHARVVARRQRLSRMLARVLRRPHVTRALVDILARGPGLANPMLHRLGRSP